MTSPWKQLKTAAEKLNSTAEMLEKAAEVLDHNKNPAPQTKQASEQAQQKTAAEKARVGQLAKTASSKLYEAGLLSSQQQADVYANQLLDHSHALNKLAQLVEHVPSSVKIGSVVVDDTVNLEPETADDVYEKRAAAVLSRYNLT